MFFTGSSENVIFPTPPTRQQTFSGPSHQYEHYKQQTGLPVGALASTMAVNQADSFSFGRGQQYLGTTADDGFLGMTTSDEFFDFNTMPNLSSSLSIGSDMDMDFGSPSQDPFQQTADLAVLDFVDPAALSGQDELSTPVAQPRTNVRAWPGMHQQQAAMAKAQEQEKQQAMASQSQKSAPQPQRRSNGSVVRPPTDPIVEERISRLLSQMRHSSVSSSNEEESTSNQHGGSSHSVRTKKDEEDMDEDERLLASEEGKKLSSKERRQLRNKVSARAFRSRRKGIYPH